MTALVNGGSGAGKLRIYTGTQPAGPGTAISTETLLAEVTLADPAYGAASSGVATMASLPRTATAVASGTAAWFRVLDSSNVAIFDDSVTATGGGGGLELGTVTISSGLTIDITSSTLTMPAS